MTAKQTAYAPTGAETMRFRKPSDYAGAAVADAPPADDMAAELAAADRARTEAQQRLNAIQTQLRQAQDAFAAARGEHLATVSRRIKGDAAADIAGSRAVMADAEDAAAALALAATEATADLQRADARYRPLAERQAAAERERRIGALASRYREALAQARHSLNQGLERCRQMEASLTEMAAIGLDGRHRANELQAEADGLPLIVGTYRHGQIVF